MDNISRKQFIKDSGKTGLIVCLGIGLGVSALLQSCHSIERVQAPLLNDVIRIDESFLQKKKHLMIENEALPAPIFLSITDDGYSALLLLCTHKSCEVNPTGETFTCPCHGSQFAKNGKRISGPAEKSLKAFKTQKVEEQVVVYLKEAP
jgi:cytochrome b6-f complex iron-sulfur subunit